MQNKITLMFTILIFCLDLFGQKVGHTTVTFVDSSRSNRQIVTEIYYPAITAGDNTPIENGVYPVITFGHGFLMTVSAYQNFWDLLIPEGYILVFPTTEGGFTPNHEELGNDLKFLIAKIQSNGAGLLIPYTSIGSTSAIMGHSMGGGSSFLAAKNNGTITTMVSFAAANTNPSAISAARQISVPTLLFTGVNDCVTPPSQHQNIMYDSTSASFKTQVNINGGGHCFFANSNFNCTFGEATCSPSPTISRAEQQSTTNAFLKLWFAYFLKKDCTKAQDFQDSLAFSSRINFRQNQSIACVTGISNPHFNQGSMRVFPNPATSLINVILDASLLGSEYMVYHCTGKLMIKGLIKSDHSIIDLAHLATGIYWVRVGHGFNPTMKLVID